jgi:hypothetical protein
MEMSSTHSLVLAALAAQEEERATGFASADSSLSMLQEQLEPSALLGLIHELRSGRLAERELAARLLVQARLPGAAVVDEVRLALGDEQDPQVIRWLVAALQYARESTGLADLTRLARHPDARVRFGVPDALSSCGERLGDVADTLVEMSKDGDRDVRWSATFELVAWVGEASPRTTTAGRDRLVERLRVIASADADPEIRSMAAQADSGKFGAA